MKAAEDWRASRRLAKSGRFWTAAVLCRFRYSGSYALVLAVEPQQSTAAAHQRPCARLRHGGDTIDLSATAEDVNANVLDAVEGGGSAGGGLRPSDVACRAARAATLEA